MIIISYPVFVLFAKVEIFLILLALFIKGGGYVVFSIYLPEKHDFLFAISLKALSHFDNSWKFLLPFFTLNS